MPQPRRELVPEARVDVPKVRPQGVMCNNTLKVKNWAGIDWDNVCFLYQAIIKQLIYLEYLN
jgi:hypothetical protein